MNLSNRILTRIGYACLAVNLVCGNLAMLIMWVTR